MKLEIKQSIIQQQKNRYKFIYSYLGQINYSHIFSDTFLGASTKLSRLLTSKYILLAIVLDNSHLD